MEERHLSERAVIDITGSADGIGRANLAPPLDWTFAPESYEVSTTARGGTDLMGPLLESSSLI